MFYHLLHLLIPHIFLFPLLVWSTYNWLQLCPHVPSPPLVYLFSSVSLFSCSNYFSCLYLFPSISLFSYSIYFSGLYLFPVTSLFSCSITLCLLILYFSCFLYSSGLLIIGCNSVLMFHLLFLSIYSHLCFVFLLHLLFLSRFIPICLSCFQFSSVPVSLFLLSECGCTLE